MNKLFIPKNAQETKGLQVATFAHDGQYRKGNQTLPYIVHPTEVAAILSNSGANSAAITAGLLHDVLEDVAPEKYSEHDMRNDFGNHITDIVKTVSKPNKSAGDWQYRNKVYLGQIATTHLLEAVEVSAADKLSNINATLQDHETYGDELWAHFNAGKEHQQWWYQAVYETCSERMPHNPIVRELGSRVVLLSAL